MLTKNSLRACVVTFLLGSALMAFADEATTHPGTDDKQPEQKIAFASCCKMLNCGGDDCKDNSSNEKKPEGDKK